MLGNRIKMLFLCTAVLFSVWGCGSEDSQSSGAGNNKYRITIDGVEVKTNFRDQPYAVVEISFTNTGSEPVHFERIGHASAFQSGIECDKILMDSGEEEGIAESMRDIQPGQTYTVHPAFYLNDTTSDLEVVVYDYLKLEEYATKVLSLQQGIDGSTGVSQETADFSDGNGNYGFSENEMCLEEVYEPILSNYYNLLQNGASADEFQKMTESDLYVSYGRKLDLNSVGYAFIDIDNDGIEELFIGFVQGDELMLEGRVTQGVFTDIYTVDSEGMIQLIANSNRRLYFYLCMDGLIGKYTSNIPFSETYEFFELYGELAGLYCASGVITYDSEEGWYVVTEGQKEILTSEQAAGMIDEHAPMQISFTPFSQFK